MTTKSKEATIQDVADAANVSIATVSRAINGTGKVSPKTKNRIHQAIQEVGYPLPLLSNRDSNVIVVGIPDLSDPFYAEILQGIDAAAERNNFEILVKIAKGDDWTQAKILNHQKILNSAGMLLTIPTNPDVVQEVGNSIPLVQCCEYSNSSLSFVSINEYEICQKVMQYLISRGKKKIALINTSSKYKFSRDRKQGYLDTLSQYQLPLNPDWIIEMPDISFSSAFSVTSQMLLGTDHPDAVFCLSDIFGAATIKAARQNGLKVPDDVAVVGFGNTYIGQLCEPTLTTVNQHRYQMGNLACEMLIDRIRNPHTPHSHVYLDAELIIRDSV